MFSQSNIGKSFNRCKGYTLIELLIALSLVAFLLMLSIPGYQQVQASMESRIVLHRLMSILNYARAEAIRTGCRVTICKSADGKTCCGDWSDGQIVFIDQKKSHLLFVSGPIKTGKLSFRGFQSSDFLRFTPSGATFEQNGSFIYYPRQTSSPLWSLLIEKSGRMRVA